MGTVADAPGPSLDSISGDSMRSLSCVVFLGRFFIHLGVGPPLKLEGVLSFLNENVYSFLSHSPTLWLKRGIPPEVKTPEVPNSSRFAASKVSALQVGIVGNGDEFLSAFCFHYRSPDTLHWLRLSPRRADKRVVA